MKTLVDFLRMTLVGGLLVVLPLWVSLLLLVKAVKSALAVLHPVAKLLPQKLVHPDMVAFCLLLLICSAVGLLIRTQLGQSIGGWLEKHLLGRIPGFSIVSSMIRQLAGVKDEQSFEPHWYSLRKRLCRRSSSRGTPMDHSRCSFHPVRRRWQVPSIFCNRNVCIR